jgi:hypothetical protein
MRLRGMTPFFLLAMIGICVPTPADAIDQVTVKVFNATTNALVRTCGPFTTTTNTLTLTSCSPFKITAQTCTNCIAQIAALPGTSENQLVLRNAVIKNVSGTTDPANNPATAAGTYRIEIEASHTFILPSPATVFLPRHYGMGLQGSFARLNAFNASVLACGDKLSKKAFYGYLIGTNTLANEDQIGVGGTGTTDDVQKGLPPTDNPLNVPSYSVPCSGSTTQNTIPVPAFSREEPLTGSGITRECVDLVSSNNCVPNKERLRETISATLAQKDSVSITQAAGLVATTDSRRDARVDTYSVQLIILQNSGQQASEVNPFDNGWLTLVLRCNADFHCADIDRASLRFGPNEVIPTGIMLKDQNKDGFEDLTMKVRQSELGILCDDTTAILNGQIFFPTEGLLDFQATVGFGTGPSCL